LIQAMEPNPQTVNYGMYILAGGAALITTIIGGTYLALQMYDKQRRTTDMIRATRLYYRFYKSVETHVPKKVRDSVIKSFRTELERRIGPERVRELNASIVGRI